MLFFPSQIHYIVFISIEIQQQFYHPVTQHCEILLWVFEISTELTILNNFVLFIPFSRPLMNMLSWTNSGTDPWGTSLETFLHSEEVVCFSSCFLCFKSVLIHKEIVCLVSLPVVALCCFPSLFTCSCSTWAFHKGRPVPWWLHGNESGASGPRSSST